MKRMKPVATPEHANTTALQSAMRLSCLALALAALQTPANAADYLWKGNWGIWEDANEWTLLGVPGQGDSAELAGGASWISTARGLGRLTMTGGRLWGTGTLNTNNLDFQRGTLGGGGLANSFPTGFTAVTGAAWFNGANTQAIAANHTLTLQGTTTWTAGTGAIGSSVYGGAIVNAAGAVFTDLGAGAANGYKALRDSGGSYSGGTFINNGTYVRTGLGSTNAYGFENKGTLDLQSGKLQLRDVGSSSGQIFVAKGSELAFFESKASVSGHIINQGLVSFDRGNVVLTNTATLNGDVKVFGGLVQNHSANTLVNLEISGGQITGTGHLTVQQLDFKSGVLGAGNTGYPTGFTTVTDTATFDGTRTQAIAANHTLTLQGTTTWTAGTGAIGSSVYGGAIVNAAGAVFTDQGAGAANGYKALRDSGGSYSGGTFINNGTYVRTGLGSTNAYGFENKGTLDLQSGKLQLRDVGSSSGQIFVAKGSELAFFESTASVSGQIVNQGLVSFDRGNVVLTNTAVLNGDVRVFGGLVQNHSANTLVNLEISGGQITGTGHLTAKHLDFNSGVLGAGNNGYPTGFTTVTDTATFDGTRTQAIAANHTLTLQGATTWSAGTGAIGSSVYGGAIVNAAGAVFTDQGAGAANAYKALRDSGGSYSGGTFINNGTYVRTGLGLTRAYGFRNEGLLHLSSGSFGAEVQLNNVGEIRIDAGAKLQSLSNQFTNHGLLGGDGTIQTYDTNQALTNFGTLTPGGLGTAGQLLLDGDLALAAASTLRFDLAADSHDVLAITSDLAFGGTLQLWADPSLALHLGDSFVVATYGQRLAGTGFNQVQWLGGGVNPFSVEYGDHSLTLRVTAAVPEPGTWALWLGGLAAMGCVARRRQALRG